MEFAERQIEQLENKVDSISEALVDIKEQLNCLAKIERGIYGDPVNNTIGLVQKQALLESEIKELRTQITIIHQKNSEQDIAITTRKTYKNKLMEWVGYGAIAFFMLKGMLDFDALFGMIFKK